MMALSRQDVSDAAFLSGAVYDANRSADVGERWTLVHRNDLGLGGPLDAFKFNGDYLFDHYNAQGFVATKGDGTLAIVFRGSSILDVSRGVGQDFFDAASAQEFHYSLFEEMIDGAIAYANNPAHGVSKVIVTGHSLGGAMAQLFEKNDGSPLTGETIITFGSPGMQAGDLNYSNVFNFKNTGDPITSPLLGCVPD